MAKIDGYMFSVTNAKFADSDGNEIEPGPVHSVAGEDLDPETAIDTVDVHNLCSFTLTRTEPGLGLLKLLDPREWGRRHWWKLPALWRRGE